MCQFQIPTCLVFIGGAWVTYNAMIGLPYEDHVGWPVLCEIHNYSVVENPPCDTITPMWCSCHDWILLQDGVTGLLCGQGLVRLVLYDDFSEVY